jgi:transposase
VRIVERKYGYKTNHHTVKRFLARYAIPVQLPLAWTVFHEFEDAYRARWTVVRMYYEGWHAQSIAGCLKLSERHVRRILTAFEHDGFAGLEDQRSRPPDHPANQLTLPLLKEVLDLQHEYPRAGRFRVHGLLEQHFQEQGVADPVPSERTVGRAMAINRQIPRRTGAVGQ